MKILILNGNPKLDLASFEDYIAELLQSMQDSGNHVKLLTLRNMEIKDCIGCYSCWLKTPGVCCLKDDMETVLKEFISSDVVLFTSPVIMGFVSALLKRVIERRIPLSHPFLQISDDRMSHVKRYNHYPSVALLLHYDHSVSQDVRENIERLFKGGMGDRFLFAKSMSDQPEEVAYALSNI